MAPREKPPTPAEEAQQMLDAIATVLEVFPEMAISGPLETLPHGTTAIRCAGHVQTQNGRIPCGNPADPRRGALCEDPRGCRREGRVNGYAS